MEVDVMKGRILLVVIVSLLVACSKIEGPSNSQFDLGKLYCNDPEAVNYNWNFPGTPDNDVCFFPRDVFEGTYLFTDTIFNKEFDIKRVENLTIKIIAKSVKDIGLVGMCSSSTDTLRFTADRFYKATADSTILQPNSVVLDGQLSCRAIDTLNGYITNLNKERGSKTKLRINFTIASDTGAQLPYRYGNKKITLNVYRDY